MSDSKILALLKKMIAHEKSARTIGNIAEAEAFAAKIQSLLLSHKLQMTEIEYAEQERTEPFGQETHGVKYGAVPQWRITLSSAIARNFFCKAFYFSGMNTVQFVGRLSDRQAVIQMYEYLGSLAKEIGLSDWKKARASYGYSTSYKAKWDKAFRQGFADAVSQRLRANSHDLTANASSTGSAIVLKETVALNQYIEQTMHLRTGRSRTSPQNFDAYARGKEHGSKVNLKSRTALGDGK